MIPLQKVPEQAQSIHPAGIQGHGHPGVGGAVTGSGGAEGFGL
jgi:hypothetical protein